MDELLRARQFAAQRERRLSEELRAGRGPDHVSGPGRPSRQPDPELLRQLAQAQNLREGLGARCLELSDRLLAAEDRLLPGRSAAEPPLRPGRAPAGPLGRERTDPQAGWGAPPIPPQRPHSSAGRDTPAGRPDPERTDPTAGASPNRPRPADRPEGSAGQTSWARAGASGDQVAGGTRPAGPGLPRREGSHSERPGPHHGPAGAWNNRPGPAAPVDRLSAPAGQPTGQQAGLSNDRFRPVPSGRGPAVPNPGVPNPAAPHPGGAPGVEDAAQSSGPMRPRTTVELVALVQRINGLHQRGAAQESAAILRQVATMITAEDVAQLATLLQQNGPAGSSTYLARSVSAGPPEHAAAALAVLRRDGLLDEAADLFHTLWSASSAALPALLAALEQSGQSADGQTLLWERASAPAEELAELAQHLKAAGRTDDMRHLLRQAAGRPINEVAAIAGALNEESAAELIRELVRLRSASDIGRFGAAIQAATDLYDTLLFAADDLEESRARSVFTALRTGGLPTEPSPRPRSRSRSRR
ncbi:hypothetical protein ACFV4P_09900 [Kitasatospora sp. NPDC059795]|uniref:hypothetical protein n=1 Tax=Kitasatospora sp. NPDC059795 TaxID=3346949 RepID=UPI00365F3171